MTRSRQCCRFVRKGGHKGQCETMVPVTDQNRSRAQVFCQAHKACSAAYNKYKKQEAALHAYIATHIIRDKSGANMRKQARYHREDFWGMTSHMVSKIKAMATEVARLRKSYSSLCTSNVAVDEGHREAGARMQRVVSMLKQGACRRGPMLAQFKAMKSRVQRRDAIADLIVASERGMQVRARNTAEHEFLKKHYAEANEHLVRTRPVPEPVPEPAGSWVTEPGDGEWGDQVLGDADARVEAESDAEW